VDEDRPMAVVPDRSRVRVTGGTAMIRVQAYIGTNKVGQEVAFKSAAACQRWIEWTRRLYPPARFVVTKG
jgi:hypothetical protein